MTRAPAQEIVLEIADRHRRRRQAHECGHRRTDQLRYLDRRRHRGAELADATGRATLHRADYDAQGYFLREEIADHHPVAHPRVPSSKPCTRTSPRCCRPYRRLSMSEEERRRRPARSSHPSGLPTATRTVPGEQSPGLAGRTTSTDRRGLADHVPHEGAPSRLTRISIARADTFAPAATVGAWILPSSRYGGRDRRRGRFLLGFRPVDRRRRRQSGSRARRDSRRTNLRYRGALAHARSSEGPKKCTT